MVNYKNVRVIADSARTIKYIGSLPAGDVAQSIRWKTPLGIYVVVIRTTVFTFGSEWLTWGFCGGCYIERC